MCSVFESPDSTHSATTTHHRPLRDSTHHRPLRVTKSADDNLDSPVSKSRATHLSESQAISPSSKDNLRFDYETSSILKSSRVPTVKVSPHLGGSESNNSSDVMLRAATATAGVNVGERPHSENYSQSLAAPHNLNIPRPGYLRENSSSSFSSGLSSSINSNGGSDTGHLGLPACHHPPPPGSEVTQHLTHWGLPTPPGSRESSPKPASSSSPSCFRSTSSSSTLINSRSQDSFCNPAAASPVYMTEWDRERGEWERERWQYWERVARDKKNSEQEQETLV